MHNSAAKIESFFYTARNFMKKIKKIEKITLFLLYLQLIKDNPACFTASTPCTYLQQVYTRGQAANIQCAMQTFHHQLTRKTVNFSFLETFRLDLDFGLGRVGID